MIIEQKIQKFLEDHPCQNTGIIWLPINKWKVPTPLSLDPDPTKSENLFILEQVNRFIDEASDVECLTSSSQYIREVKKYFLLNKERVV